jgi:anti-sigma regulatory factor (Ser/Thr protein kinase)
MPAGGVAFRHEALFHEGDGGFLAGAVPFVRDGLAAGEPILVAVGPERIALLRRELGDDADRVHFADMRELGRNPGRIIPAWHAFLHEHDRRLGGIRGIGEPIWAGRRPAELSECQLHESLLNLAFAGVDGFRLLCPYDVEALEDHVLHEACCSHPTVIDVGGGRASPEYRGDELLLAPFEAPLPKPAAAGEILGFEHDGLSEVRALVARGAGDAGLSAERASDIVLAASEVAANSLRHGGGRGVLRLWREDGGLVCEIRDRGHIRDPLVGRQNPRPGQPGGWGLWLAHRVCDLVQVRSQPGGTVVRLLMRAA